MENILEVTGLNKNYPNFSLKDVSFALPDGCITGFIGKNGAGKTPIIKNDPYTFFYLFCICI